MPLRRNECQSCGFRFRTLEGAAPINAPTCPACGSRKTKRLLPRVAVQFKGNGYYKTDYAHSSGPEEASADGRSTVAASAESTPDE